MKRSGTIQIKGAGSISKDQLWQWLGLSAIVLTVLFVRLRLLSIPLERDEGDYAYHAWMLLDGTSLGSDFIRKRFFIIYLIYAVFIGLFGTTAAAVHTGLLAVNLATIFLLFYFIKRLTNPMAGVISAASFAILSLLPEIHGLGANREHYLIFTALLGYFILYKALQDHKWWRYALSGLLLGLAFTIKEQGSFFILFGGGYLVYRLFSEKDFSWIKNIKRILLFSFPVFIPYILIVVTYLFVGAFDEFWFRTITFKSQYASNMTFETGITIFQSNMGRIFSGAPVLWSFALLGLTTPLWYPPARKHAVFILGLACFSVASIVPGYYFRPHYFILLLPAASLLSALAVTGIYTELKKRVTKPISSIAMMLIIIFSFITPIINYSNLFFQLTLPEVSREVYGYNPFPESTWIAEVIENNTREDDRVLIMGSEPQVLFYARRKSAISNIYMYDLNYDTDFSRKQQQLSIKEVKRSKPEMVVLFNIPTSWLFRTNSDKSFIRWFEQYSIHYKRIAVIDFTGNQPVYITGDQAPGYKTQSKLNIVILKRRANAG